MSQPNSMIGKFFFRIWKTVDVAGRLLIGLLAIFLFSYMIRGCISGPDLPEVKSGSALVLAPSGVLVEQKTYINPVNKVLEEVQGNSLNETLVADLVDAINYAKDDKNIQLMVLSTRSLAGAYGGITKYQDIRKALVEFKASGKKIITTADNYGQNQYYLASMADEIYLNPQGMLMFEGMGRYRTYFKSAIDKIGVKVNIFRVGTFKSALEPYFRDSMSDAAKEANIEWMGDLWNEMKTDIASSRNKTGEELDTFAQNFAELFKAAGGNGAKLALEQGWVDGLKTRGDFRDYMIEKVGMNKKKTSFKQIHHDDYLLAKRPPIQLPSTKADQIAVVVAKGNIVDGEHKEGVVGGDNTARLIRKARLNDKVKAILLRVDSPGGSAFASEIIRAELERAQTDGKIVVASMGGMAASGGYWISATSDEIWAQPSTITGSIGIFGMIPTFEKPLTEIGISRDGVGTTKFANAIDPMQDLSAEVSDIFQTAINNGYDEFLSLVARGRDMTKEQVDAIAQGRVWSGADAKRLGLVDELGDLDDAIKAAAKLANIEDYGVVYMKREKTAQEVFIENLMDNTQANLSGALNTNSSTKNPIVEALTNELKQMMNTFGQFNDPNHAYIHCMCEIK